MLLQVFGVGIPNPYRIRPILGAKVPVNSSFSPLIHMHNPHSSTLQVCQLFKIYISVFDYLELSAFLCRISHIIYKLSCCYLYKYYLSKVSFNKQTNMMENLFCD